MIEMRSAILRIASTVCFTASPPSAASREACVAMPSVTRAFSLFWFTDADICSIDADVSSTPADCSLAP